MTEKLPRRWSRRVVVSSGSVHPNAVTRVVSSSSSAAQAASPAPRRIISDGSRMDGSNDPLPSGRGPRALVVDDDPETRRALARLLRPELEVHLVGSVAQAAAVLARLDRVDVAFVDWELPDGTGEQILERLSHWPDAIRVLISARVVSSENPLKNRALANLVLGKPLALGAVEALKRAALALPHG
jgi:CheY-like chemotaxis protein